MDSLICTTSSLENNAFSVLHYVIVALHYSTLHRLEIFSAPGTIAHGSIRQPPRRLAKTRGCSLAIKSCDAKRLQKRERQKKKKKSKGLISKKKTTTSNALHTFFFTFLCRCGCNVKLPSNTFYGENVVCAHKKHLLLVFLFAFFFTAAHFHLAGRWHFSASL